MSAQLSAFDHDGVRPIEPGRLIEERYRIVRPVGRGGMGEVYEAERVGLGLRVALKFPKWEDRLDARRARQLVEEARCLARLRHENVVQVLDHGSTADGSYFVLEFVDGRTLREELEERGLFEWSRAVRLVRQVALGLGAAHKSGIIHRDLKSSNIMLTHCADGTELAKVLDFGIACRVGVPSGVTTTQSIPGTAAYMAPEVARGESRGDEHSDSYSVGVVLYELLTGRRPHEGDSSNAIVYSLLTKVPVPLERHRPGLPPALVELVSRGIEKDPRARVHSMDEWVRELEALLSKADRASAPAFGGAGATEPGARPASKRSEGSAYWAYGLAALASVGVALGLGSRFTTAPARHEVASMSAEDGRSSGVFGSFTPNAQRASVKGLNVSSVSASDGVLTSTGGRQDVAQEAKGEARSKHAFPDSGSGTRVPTPPLQVETASRLGRRSQASPKRSVNAKGGAPLEVSAAPPVPSAAPPVPSAKAVRGPAPPAALDQETGFVEKNPYP